MPRKGQAALPLVQLAYDRDNPSPNKSHNQIEQDALLALLVGALPPMGVRASRGLGRHQGLPSIGQASSPGSRASHHHHHLLHY
ncbi:MAG: hypothetical protein M3122_09635 [Actinomycetota bacterium]|nr:hypothetical protein [Actinomycetota bacterium]